jgi:hypothetical protein
MRGSHVRPENLKHALTESREVVDTFDTREAAKSSDLTVLELTETVLNKLADAAFARTVLDYVNAGIGADSRGARTARAVGDASGSRVRTHLATPEVPKILIMERNGLIREYRGEEAEKKEQAEIQAQLEREREYQRFVESEREVKRRQYPSLPILIIVSLLVAILLGVLRHPWGWKEEREQARGEETGTQLVLRLRRERERKQERG